MLTSTTGARDPFAFITTGEGVTIGTKGLGVSTPTTTPEGAEVLPAVTTTGAVVTTADAIGADVGASTATGASVPADTPPLLEAERGAMVGGGRGDEVGETSGSTGAAVGVGVSATEASGDGVFACDDDGNDVDDNEDDPSPQIDSAADDGVGEIERSLDESPPE